MIALSLLLPLALVAVIASAGVLASSRRRQVRRVAGIFSPLTVLPAVALTFRQPGAPGTSLDVPWLLLGSSFVLDAIARPLVLIAALLYGAALMSVSWLKLRDAERGSGVLSAFLLTCFVGNIGVFLAADVVSFYFAFTLVSFAALGLVIHYRTKEAKRASQIYLVFSVLAETAILAGLLILAAQMWSGPSPAYLPLEQAPAAVASSPHTGLIIALLLFGFGVKAGTVPLHVWLPLAHPAAPPAGSAVLSGAIVKVGLVGWLRLLPPGTTDAMPTSPEASATIATYGWILLASALAGALFAALLGVLQSDPKVVLAYSTISQMGFMAAIVSVGLIEPEVAGVTSVVAVLYAVHHGLAKGALFLGIPVAKHYGRGLAGLVVTVGLAGAALAVAGAPLTSGAFGKYVSKDVAGTVLVFGIGLDQILPFVATGSTLLLLRYGWAMWNTERDPRRRPDGELVSWLLVVAAGVAVPWWVGVRWMPLGVPAWEADAIWTATWPILLGLGLAVGGWLLASWEVLPRWVARAEGSAVQPGDLLVAGEAGFWRADLIVRRGVAVMDRWSGAAARGWSWLKGWTVGMGGRLVAVAETRLGAWEASGLVLLALLAGMVLLSVIAARWFG